MSWSSSTAWAAGQPEEDQGKILTLGCDMLWWWWVVSNMSGWLLELLTELTRKHIFLKYKGNRITICSHHSHRYWHHARTSAWTQTWKKNRPTLRKCTLARYWDVTPVTNRHTCERNAVSTLNSIHNYRKRWKICHAATTTTSTSHNNRNNNPWI